MKYSKEFKEEALKLSDEIGLKKAAQQLGIQYYTLSDWYSTCMEGSGMPENEKIELYEDQPIRTAWNETEEEWYFSIVDVVGVLTDQSDI